MDLILHLAVTMAWPIVYGVYLGIAESARDLVVQRTRERGVTTPIPTPWSAKWRTNSLYPPGARRHGGDRGHRGARQRDDQPDHDPGRTLVGQAAIRTVDRAMEVMAGAALYRNTGLERLFRDVQGARYHPLVGKGKHRYAGRMALCLDIDG